MSLPQTLPSWIDLVAGLLLAFAFLRGCMKGLVSQLAGVVSVVGGLLVARAFAKPAGEVLAAAFPGLAGHAGADVIVAFVVLFFAVSLVVALVARLLRRVVEGMHLAALDRLLGGLFGAIKTTAFVAFLVASISLLDLPPLREPIGRSFTGRVAELVVECGGPLFPEEFRTRVKAVGDELRVRFAPTDPTAPGGPATLPEAQAGERVPATSSPDGHAPVQPPVGER